MPLQSQYPVVVTPASTTNDVVTGITGGTVVDGVVVGGKTANFPLSVITADLGNVTITGGTINGTLIGNTNPSTGSFTTLSASSTVSGTGFSTYLASPPAIGGTAPAAGSFTTLSASGTVSGTGFSTYLASPPAIGGTAPAAGSFTTLSASGTVSGTGFITSLASPPAIGGTAPAAGTFTTVTAGTGSFTNFSATTAVVAGNFIPSQTNGIVGTTTNNNANAGSVGEFLTATATVSIASNTATSIVTLSLTAGDWDVRGNVEFNPGSTVTASGCAASIGTASASLTSNESRVSYPGTVTGGTVIPLFASMAPTRFPLSTTTNVILVASATTSASVPVTGIVSARRIR